MNVETALWCVVVVALLCVAIVAAHVWHDVEQEQEEAIRETREDFYNEVPE